MAENMKKQLVRKPWESSEARYEFKRAAALVH